MFETAMAARGMVTAPHHLASESALAVLRDGGNAIEAMVAAAATIAVVYPHMNSIGGDSFWLVKPPGAAPVGIRACGPTGRGHSLDAYLAAGHNAIPSRGPLAANTVAGTIGGWAEVLALGAELGGRLPLPRLLEDAIHHAEAGAPVTASQARHTAAKLDELRGVPGFAATYLPDGAVPAAGSRFRQPALAGTLRALATDGLDSFYRGALARRIAAGLARVGSPVTGEDYAGYRAARVVPLGIELSAGRVWNMPPPTQGITSLMILGIFDRLGVREAEGFAHLHGLIEATKHGLAVRNAEVCDPAHMRTDPASFLSDAALAKFAAAVDPARAAPWPQPAAKGDTIWMGAIDGNGLAVSVIQSIYWEYGSGVVLEDTGLLLQNRGSSFNLLAGAHNCYGPGRLPLHTLNPAMAELSDGRVVSYGTMGGDGQPQTQAAVFSRYALFGEPLQAAVTAPRWLLGKTWGQEKTNLRIESRLDPGVVAALAAAGHDVEVVEPFTDLMGHAGAVVHRPDGLFEGASDPRSDGRAAGF